MGQFLRKHVFTKENLVAVILAIALVVIIVFTADTSPTWIYQGF
jgi:hypothetical protein